MKIFPSEDRHIKIFVISREVTQRSDAWNIIKERADWPQDGYIEKFIQDDIREVVYVIVHSDIFPEVPLGVIPEMIFCLSKEK